VHVKKVDVKSQSVFIAIMISHEAYALLGWPKENPYRPPLAGEELLSGECYICRK
jgi:hypothetical protein